MTTPKNLDAAQGVQSVELGLALFGLLAQHGKACSLSDLARQADMHRAKVYRYLVSLQRTGWVAQDPATGLYELGPAIRDLAMGWLSRQDTLNLALKEAHQLAQSQGETCFVAIWGLQGATAVRVFPPARAVAISVAEGALMDPTSSATGRVFAVWRDEAAEVLPTALQASIRKNGFAAVKGEHVEGINAVSAPVFDGQGRLVLTLTLVGPAASLEVRADGAAARALRAVCQRLSLIPANLD